MLTNITLATIGLIVTIWFVYHRNPLAFATGRYDMYYVYMIATGVYSIRYETKSDSTTLLEAKAHRDMKSGKRRHLMGLFIVDRWNKEAIGWNIWAVNPCTEDLIDIDRLLDTYDESMGVAIDVMSEAEDRGLFDVTAITRTKRFQDYYTNDRHN